MMYSPDNRKVGEEAPRVVTTSPSLLIHIICEEAWMKFTTALKLLQLLGGYAYVALILNQDIASQT